MDEFRRRHQERADRLLERRRELLKRAGANIEDMTRRSLANHPEDPRTVQLRKELEEVRSAASRREFESARRIEELSASLRLCEAEQSRDRENLKDLAQMRDEIIQLNEKLQLREKELMAERQRNEDLRQQQAINQQTLMTRIARLESPSIGSTESFETNQSREAKMVKLPNWMRFRR